MNKEDIINILQNDLFIEILNILIYHNKELELLKDKLINYDLNINNLTKDNYKEILNKYDFSYIERKYIKFFLLLESNFKDILNNLIDILQIEFNNNKKLILYYDISNPLIGFIDNKKYYNQIITNRHLKLDNNKYFIFNYDIDNVILHWTGYINNKHYITYAGLRLFRLNNKLFNEIYNDVKLLKDEEFKNKYSKISDVLLNRSIQSIYECTKRNINFNDEFNNLVKYINDNKQQRKILYRGDRRYKKTDFSSNIIEYKNVHPFADNKEEALKFMTNYYFGYDENIKEYNFFILLNGYTARIRAFLLDNLMGRNKNFLPIYRINNDWIEYLHNPVKYKIIDFKKETINYKYQNGLEKEINYNLIIIEEII